MGYTINKLFSVPHGITVNALGNCSQYDNSTYDDCALCELLKQL